MRAFQTALKPSRSLKILSALLHLAAASSCLIWFHGIMLPAGLAALTLSFLHSMRVLDMKGSRAVTAVEIDRHYRSTIFLQGKPEAASPDESSMITPYALFIQWNTAGKTIRHCITPDMTDRESYRRLKIWLRWCHPKTADVQETED